MPTLLEVEGFRSYFFSLEGTEPPHVHVRRGGGKAKFFRWSWSRQGASQRPS